MAVDATVVIHTSLKIAALLVTIAPLVGVVAMMKLVKGVSDKFGVPIPGEKFGGKMKGKADDFSKRAQGRRAIRALNSDTKFRPGYGKYRREARLDAKTRGIESEKNRAAQTYVASQMTNPDGSPTRFGKQVAGGSMFGAADPGALERALAGAKFTIEKAEAEEVQAHHATIDSMDSAALTNIVKNADGSNSDTKVAAAIERLVKIGKTSEVAEAVDKYGSSGENNVVTKTLANSLAKDGPGFLKSSDIDNIARGQLGKNDASGRPIAASMKEIASKNVENGVYSQEKMVAATADELSYASLNTSNAGRAKLQATAGDLKANDTLKGKIKHNEAAINDIDRQGWTRP